MYSRVIDSPIGYLTLTASDSGLKAIHISLQAPEENYPFIDNDILTETTKQINSYFKKELRTFDLPLDFDSAHEFSKSVWKLLVQIPYGTTRSYGDIARQLGDIKKSRAVGLANGSNPIAIVVPCHRVIGADGSLTGYGGGLAAKEYLLTLENPNRWVRQGVLF